MSGILSIMCGLGSQILNDATGGTVYRFGDYQYNVFTSSGNFKFTKQNSSGQTVLVLLIGGGDGGYFLGSEYLSNCGQNGGDGGNGASSWLSASNLFTVASFTLNTDYAVTVGAGGSQGGYVGSDSTVTIGGTQRTSATGANSPQQGYAGGFGCDSDPGNPGTNGADGVMYNTDFSDLGTFNRVAGAGGGGGGGAGSSGSPGGDGGNGGDGGGGGGGSGGEANANGNDGIGGSINIGGGGGGSGGAGGKTTAGYGGGASAGNGGSGAVVFKFKYK